MFKDKSFGQVHANVRNFNRIVNSSKIRASSIIDVLRNEFIFLRPNDRLVLAQLGKRLETLHGKSGQIWSVTS